MAYAWDTYYYFQSHNGTSGLYLNREGSGAVQPNQNISIYKKVGSGANPDHQFKLVRAYDNSGNVAGCTLRSALGSNYALNIYGYGSSMTAEGNCDLYPVGGQYPGSSNYDDSLIDLLTVDAAQNLYKITLIKHPGLYLTPEGNYNNANVKWAKSSREDAHVWKLCTSETSGGGSTGGEHEISGLNAYNYNQKAGPTAGFKAAGCACACGMDVASFYAGRWYSFDEFRGYYDDYSDTDYPYIVYSWKTPAGYQFAEDKAPNGMSEADTIAYIKRYIDAGIPPICHCLPVTKDQHWVVPFKYESGSGWDSIWVLDTYLGVERRMNEAMNLSCGGTSGGVDRIMHHPSYSLK